MTDFTIYYSDGTYTGDPENAPTRDVQVIIQPCPKVGWTTLHSTDYYLWRADRWRVADNFGLWDYMVQPGWKRVLFGRTLDDEEFRKVYYRAKAECKIRKGGFLPGERKP